MMLSPLSLHASLEALTSSSSSSEEGFSSDTRPDLAALVLTEDGSLYASSSSSSSSRHTSSSSKSQYAQPLPTTTPLSGLEQQYLRKPGLRGLLGFGKPGLRAPSQAPLPTEIEAAAAAADNTSTMNLDMRPDERIRVLCALARQAWLEEVARVRRLRAEANERDEEIAEREEAQRAGENQGIDEVEGRAKKAEEEDMEEEMEERVNVDVALPGTMLPNGVAPLLVESELGPLVVVPLHGRTTDSPPLLLVLSKDVDAVSMADRQAGFSSLSQAQWSSLHEAGAAYRTFVGPQLKRAFGNTSAATESASSASSSSSILDRSEYVDESGDESITGQ